MFKISSLLWFIHSKFSVFVCCSILIIKDHLGDLLIYIKIVIKHELRIS